MKYLLLLFLVSCNIPGKVIARSWGVEADFSLYVNKFNTELAMLGRPPVDISHIAFYKTYTVIEGHYDGMCSKGDDVYKISVVTDDTTFDVRTYFIIIHELGHCAYNLKHIEQPGIMNANSNIGMDFNILDNRLELIKQMLSGGLR